MSPRATRGGGRRGVGGATASVACLLLAPACAHAAPATPGPRIAPRQEIVAVLGDHAVRAGPGAAGRLVASVGARRPITGERTVLPLLARAIDDRGGSWLRVRLPGRVPGGRTPPRTGWLSASNTRRSTTAWHIVVLLGAQRVVVYRFGRPLRSYRAVVGKRSTPTPVGEYFVEENVQLPAARVGAPFALATSARSGVLQEFDGGPGQIALHGLANVGGRLGSAASHGCVRLAATAVTWLAARIKPGVPVTIG